MKTLLEQAMESRSSRGRVEYTKEHWELVRGWLVGDVTTRQVSTAMGYKTLSNVYAFVGMATKQAVRNGWLILD